MFYIEERDNEFIKYKVTLDVEKLTHLKSEIIENCSQISHKKYESDYEPYFIHQKRNGKDIRNYHSRKTLKKKEYFEETRDIYEIEYDEYKHSVLVEYINKLLLGDTSVIPLLKAYKGVSLVKDRVKVTLNVIRSDLEKELNKEILDINIGLLEINLKFLKEFQETVKRNQSQKRDMDYYQDIINCISLTEVNRLNKEEHIKEDDFIIPTYTKKYNK